MATNILDKIASDPAFINRGIGEATEPLEVAAVPVSQAPVLKAGPPLAGRAGERHVVQMNLLPGRSWIKLIVKIGIIALVPVAGVGGFVWYTQRPVPAAVVRATPTPRPSMPVSPSASPTPVATPKPTPVSTPVSQTVTAPAVAPTAGHPQAVTITSKSGLWLRSGPNSSSQNNIIGWMPDGTQISVDAVGDFWWHGTYKGTSGYFASKYTQ